MKTTFIISIFLATAIMAGSCNNPSGSAAAQTQTTQKMTSTARVIPVSMTTVNEASATATNSAVESINAAKAAGKPVFLVVTGSGATGTDKAMTIANAANFISKNAVVLQMNRDDAANAKLVSEYRLAGAPVPLILVISSKGMPTGGYILEQATAENLAALIPSPRLEDVFEAISNNMTALVVFSRKTFTDKAVVLKECKSAVSKLNNKAVIVEVDMDDNREVNFMNQLRIDKNQFTGSLTLVINTQGQVAGTSTTIPDAAKLALAATTPIQGGCGPGCGPQGCGK